MDEVLESMGYRVIMAADGLEAFEISIILLYMIMPHMGRAQLGGKIRAMNSDIPVIFLTGYDKGHVLHGDDAIANCDVLTKPVNFDDLSHSIRQLLD